MPVIVVGADTIPGNAIVDALIDPGREVRVFVSDPAQGEAMKARGAKVALGDVSDDTHIDGAATRCFSAILVTDAARDSRERAFAETEDQVLRSWARGVAKVKRVIWVHDGDEPPPVDPDEVAIVSPGSEDFVERVVALDNAKQI